MSLIYLWDVKTSLFFHYINTHWARHSDGSWCGKIGNQSPHSHRAHSFDRVLDKRMVVVNIGTWRHFHPLLYWSLVGTRRLETTFPKFPFQKDSRYSLGSANMNHNLTFVRQKRSGSHTTLLEKQTNTWALKGFVAAWRHFHRSNLSQRCMAVVAIFTSSLLLFSVLREGWTALGEASSNSLILES